MNKREVVWLIVRLIGVYFAYLAIVSVFTLVGSISAFYTLSSEGGKPEIENVKPLPPGIPGRIENDPKVNTKTDPLSEKAKSEAFKTLLLNIFLTGLYGGVAFYLIAKGTVLFNILSKETVVRRSEKQTVTTIRL